MSLPSGPLILAAVACIGGVYVAQDFAGRQYGENVLAVAQPQVLPSVEDEAPLPSGTLKIPGAGGQFSLEARIGTRTAPFIVDTGASIVALTWETGYNLGLVSIGEKMDAQMSTANGSVMAKFVTISRIETGMLRVDNIPAVVMPKGALAQNLLGMSFLSRLKSYGVTGNVLTLSQ